MIKGYVKYSIDGILYIPLVYSVLYILKYIVSFWLFHLNIASKVVSYLPLDEKAMALYNRHPLRKYRKRKKKKKKKKKNARWPVQEI